MAGIDEPIMIYSVQKTYNLTIASTSGKGIMACNQRIDIPTIEPSTDRGSYVYESQEVTVVPCIELAGFPLDAFDFTFETNEGVTVLPVKIEPVSFREPTENPYLNPIYVLVLPRGTTGVKSCKIIYKGTSKEVQHNFTFGIMPPPYNYDNALFGYIVYKMVKNDRDIINLDKEVTNLKARVTALENKAGG